MSDVTVTLPDDAPVWAQVLHRDLGGMRAEAKEHAARTHDRLGDVVAAVQGVTAEVAALTRATEQRAAVDAAWVQLVARIVDHPTVGRLGLAAGVLILVRLLLPPSAEQAVVGWMLRMLGGS